MCSLFHDTVIIDIFLENKVVNASIAENVEYLSYQIHEYKPKESSHKQIVNLQYLGKSNDKSKS